jgi:hypothetical protein
VNTIKELLPLSAILIVIVLMTFTDLIVIGEVGRIFSLIPISLVLIIWSLAVAKIRRNESVR